MNNIGQVLHQVGHVNQYDVMGGIIILMCLLFAYSTFSSRSNGG